MRVSGGIIVQAEIITIGTELLLGEIVDTNSAYMAQRLAAIGLNLFYTTTVGDNEERIAEAIRGAMQRSDVIITTGGLGPTVDDVTRPAVARATGRELVFDPDLLAQIEAFFHKRGRQMSENNRRQAFLPQGAIPIPNPVGTAPAYIVEEGEKVVISLPGVPHEMRFLFENHVLPYLRRKFNLAGVIKSRVLRTCGIGESQVGSLLDDLMRGSNPTVGTAAHPGQTDVRITAKAESDSAADALIAPVEEEIRARLGIHIFGTDEETLEEVVLDLLQRQNETLALAEGGTKSLISERLIRLSNAKEVLLGAMVSPDPMLLLESFNIRVKGEDSKITPEEHGKWIALALAEAVRRRYGADWGLAVLGECPLGPSTDDTSANAVYLALANEGVATTQAVRYNRLTPGAIGWTVTTALDMLRRELLATS